MSDVDIWGYEQEWTPDEEEFVPTEPIKTSDFGVEDITKIPPAKPGQDSKL